MKRKNLVGEVFGTLTVTAFSGVNTRYESLWTCRCSCGTTVIRNIPSLRASSRCAKCNAHAASIARTKHGMSFSPEYAVWRGILARCLNPKCEQFPNYGGRGITVCRSWKTSFERFLSAVGRRPSADHSIERKNNAGNYTPSNVVWATQRAQKINTRRNRLLTFHGKTQPLILWAEELGIPYSRLQKRLENGWSIERALTSPKRINGIA